MRVVERDTELSKSTFAIPLNQTLWTSNILETTGTSRCHLDAPPAREQ
jgi:hypothetical protein